MPKKIHWNQQVKLILSDVDETVADLYVPAAPAMIAELSRLLAEGKRLFFITGQGLHSVKTRILDFLPQKLLHHVLVGPCGGAEVWGHDQQGVLHQKPFYSVYEDTLDTQQRTLWRKIISQIIAEFNLVTWPTMPVAQFKQEAGDNPLAVMMEDRGPQITFEVVNGYDLQPEQTEKLEVTVPEVHGVYDLRTPILQRATELFAEHQLPIAAKIAGAFAVDFMVEGVSKKTAVEYVLNNEDILRAIGLAKDELSSPVHLEIWGDKFSTIRGGSDRYMSEAVDKKVRSIDFRQENPEEFEPGYNIVVWNGEQHLHNGLLEYLQGRQT